MIFVIRSFVSVFVEILLINLSEILELGFDVIFIVEILVFVNF